MVKKKIYTIERDKDNPQFKRYHTMWADLPTGCGDSEIFDEYIDATDQQRNTALANVSNQTANTTTGKMGYKVLDGSKSFASQVTAENTIYEIKDVFDLNNGNITIPANCALNFNGGIVKNCEIIGNNTNIYGEYRFHSVTFDGTFVLEQLDIDNVRFNQLVDLEGILHSFHSTKVVLHRNIEQSTILGTKPFFSINLQGNGYTIKIPKLYHTIDNLESVYIDNTVFDCDLAVTTFLELNASGTQKASVTNCKFINASYHSVVFFENCFEPVFCNNVINGTLDEEWVEEQFQNAEQPDIYSVSFYDCYGNARCCGNIIKDVNIGGMLFSSPLKITNVSYTVDSNTISDLGGGGVKSWGASIIYDFVFTHNKISNIDCFNTSGENGVHNPTNKAAINIHGFNNLTLSGNIFTNIIYPNCIDIDGKHVNDGVTTREAGIDVVLNDNTFKNISVIIFAYCENIKLCNNTIKLLNSRITLQDCKNVNITGNDIEQVSNNYPSGETPSVFNAYVPITFFGGILNDVGYVWVERNNIIGGDYAEKFLAIASSVTTDKNIFINDNQSSSTKTPYPLTYDCADTLVPFIKTKDIEKSIILNKDTNPSVLLYAMANVGYVIGQYEEIKGVILSKSESEYIGSQSLLLTRHKKTTTKSTVASFTISAKNPGDSTLVADLGNDSIRLNYALYRTVLLELDSASATAGDYLVTIIFAPKDSRRYKAYAETEAAARTITMS